ncbi:hypothetical protein ASF00_10395 [Sphingomonas sp. Leaf34]|nr:hypothetical protein ASF00_10395 [Sphingomonas sp. Leaf34]
MRMMAQRRASRDVPLRCSISTVNTVSFANESFPGAGRGPVGKVAIMKRCSPFLALPDWVPAFAGEACPS